MNEILTLIRSVHGVDDYGDPAIAEIPRVVFCRVASIGQKEFYQAQALGLQPETKFVLADYLEYQGEMQVEYNNTRYRVLRTYRTSQELELVCYREVNPA